MSGDFLELKKIIDSMPFACAIVDNDLHIKHLNVEMSGFLGYSEQRFTEDELFTKFLPEDEVPQIIDYLKADPPSQKTNPWKMFKLKNKKGECNQILVSKLKEKKYLLPYHYDVLIGIPMQNINLESTLDNMGNPKNKNGVLSNKYRSIFNNAIIGIIIFDDDHCIEEMNQTFADKFGIDIHEVIGQKIENVLSEPMIEKVENLLVKTNLDKNRFVKDVVTYVSDFNEHNILEISLSKFQNPHDSNDKNMMIVEDITKEKDTHEALIQSEKLALTGRLAASLAHEINNPLQASIGCLGLVDEILDEEDRNSDFGIYINLAMDELKRGARIVKKLRDLHRKSDASEKTLVDVKKIIDDVLILSKNQLYDRNIVTVFPFQGTPPVIAAVRDQIQSVILNIIINAIDAMPGGGYIYIEIDTTEDPEGVIMKIRDTGKGMEKAVIENLFDPFFTTKEEGVGLGLYLSKEIVKDHNGHIQVESEIGQGTIFTIWLPEGDNPEGEE